MKPSAALLLLAGGRGRRMGGEGKLLLRSGKAFLIEKILEETEGLFSEYLLSCAFGKSAETERLLAPVLRKWRIKVVEDREPERGPLEGLCRGLAAMSGEWLFAVGCDMPSVRKKVVLAMAQRLQGADAAVAELNGWLEPLHAFYSERCLRPAECALAEGRLRLKSFYPEIRLAKLPEAELREADAQYYSSFFNINTQEEYSRYTQKSPLTESGLFSIRHNIN